MSKVSTALLRVAVLCPGVLASLVAWCGVLALVPPPLATPLVLGALTVFGALATGRFEVSAVRVMARARRPMAAERHTVAAVGDGLGRLGFSEANLLIRKRHGVSTPAVTALTRTTVVLDPVLVEATCRGSVSTVEAVALVAHEWAAHRAQRSRLELATMAAMTPWRVAVAAFGWIGAAFAWMPLARFAWAARGLVGIVCVLQSLANGRAVTGLIGGAVIALSYVIPRARRTLHTRAEREGDHSVVDCGLGAVLAGVLIRFGCVVSVERLRRLEQQTGSRAAPPGAQWLTSLPAVSLN